MLLSIPRFWWLIYFQQNIHLEDKYKMRNLKIKALNQFQTNTKSGVLCYYNSETGYNTKVSLFFNSSHVLGQKYSWSDRLFKSLFCEETSQVQLESSRSRQSIFWNNMSVKSYSCFIRPISKSFQLIFRDKIQF